MLDLKKSIIFSRNEVNKTLGKAYGVMTNSLDENDYLFNE